MNILNDILVRNNQQPLPLLPAKTESKTKTSIFYSNDVHGQVPKMQRLVSAAEHSELEAKKKGSDILKLSAGDTFIGSDEKRNAVGATFLDIADFDAAALGNHEFDITASICGNLLKNLDTKILGMNLNFPTNACNLSQKVLRSTIVNGESGEKYGLIGVQPSDLASRIKKKEILEGITSDDQEQTLKELQVEVDKLRKQGINKVILLSHEGYNFEKEIAQKVDGIDVIIGGHSHDLIEGVKQGKNLLYSPSGDPVVITQAGRDGNYYGVLNLEFDEQGKISYVQNNIRDTNFFSPNLLMTNIVDKMLGKSPVIGNLAKVDPIPRNNLVEENPWADFVSDAVKTRLDADIALINSANFRGSVDKGTITERDITSIFPFNNKLFKVRINEEDVVNCIKKCAKKTMTSKNSKPGLMQVSGLEYTVTKTGDVTSIIYTDKQGNKRPIDVNNPSKDFYFTAVYDEFLIGGGDDMDMMKREDKDIITRYDFDKDKVTIDYIKTLQQPFEVHKDGRIKVIQ